MQRLVIQQYNCPPQQVPLVKSAYTIGRHVDNDIVVMDDQVSSRHLRLETLSQGVLLRDLNSTNGTMVNGLPATERMLKPGDEIQIGQTILVFEQTDQAAPTLDTTMLKETPRPKRKEDSAVLAGLRKVEEEVSSVAEAINKFADQAHSRDALETPIRRVKSGLVVVEKAYKRLSALYEASKSLISGFDLKHRLDSVIDTALEVMNAERGFVLLKDEKTGRLKVEVARQMGRDLEEISLSMSIASQAAANGEAVITSDAEIDERFRHSQSVAAQHIRSVMCVPLQVEDRILGSIYVDTRVSRAVFEKEDLELFSSLAGQAAMAIENSRLYERMIHEERVKSNLRRYLSPSVVEEVMNRADGLTLGGEKKVATVLFSDIREYTKMSEQMAPDAIVDMLNQYFTEMTRVIFSHQGTIDKFIGDEIMVVFGAPLSSPDDALRAVRTAMDMQAKAQSLKAAWSQEGRRTLEIGIGINTGEVVAGNIGSPDVMQFTIISDMVNVARRITEAAGPAQVLISSDTYAQVRDCIDARNLGPMKLRGKAIPVDVYEVLKVQ